MPYLDRMILLLAICLTSCVNKQLVTRGEVILMAQAYHQHRWMPTSENVKHGFDPDGIKVHTPDVSLSLKDASRPGFWKPNEMNVGLPYQWGGFDRLEGFDQKIKEGYFAGDVYTRQKRKLLEKGVSRYAAGIDCSGMISRCWKLSRHHSTRELPSLCDPLPSYASLQAGDILNKHNDHVLLFWAFTDDSQTEILAYEVGSPPSWVVMLNQIPVDYLKGLDYQPYRYRNIRP